MYNSQVERRLKSKENLIKFLFLHVMNQCFYTAVWACSAVCSHYSESTVKMAEMHLVRIFIPTLSLLHEQPSQQVLLQFALNRWFKHIKPNDKCMKHCDDLQRWLLCNMFSTVMDGHQKVGNTVAVTLRLCRNLLLLKRFKGLASSWFLILIVKYDNSNTQYGFKWWLFPLLREKAVQAYLALCILLKAPYNNWLLAKRLSQRWRIFTVSLGSRQSISIGFQFGTWITETLILVWAGSTLFTPFLSPLETLSGLIAVNEFSSC